MARVRSSGEGSPSSEARRSPAGAETDIDPAVVRAAVEGDTVAMRSVIEALRPAIQAEVAWTLERLRASSTGRSARQELADLVQEVFVALLERDGRVLRAWRPERGRTLRSFARLVARHEVISLVRSGRRSPWRDDPTPPEVLELEPSANLAERLADADEARRVVEELRCELSGRSMLIFEDLYVDERSVEEVCAAHGLTREAVYAWRTRLRRRVVDLMHRLSGARP